MRKPHSIIEQTALALGLDPNSDQDWNITINHLDVTAPGWRGYTPGGQRDAAA